jgi:anti-sigma factor RsiW
MRCAEALRVQAYFDGELDAADALRVEEHLASCPECASAIEELDRNRSELRNAAYYRAPAALRTAVTAAIAEASGPPASRRVLIPRTRAFWSGAGAGAFASALAAALALFLMVPSPSSEVETELTGAHVRSLMAGHLIDVESSDQHTVKPWFAGHADVSPPTPDFPKEDYRLIGGRADYIDGRRAAVVVYRHGKHIINVFSWTQHGGAVPSDVTRNGYHMAFWRSSNLVFCAVSDTQLSELDRFVSLMKVSALQESRE